MLDVCTADRETECILKCHSWTVCVIQEAMMTLLLAMVVREDSDDDDSPPTARTARLAMWETTPCTPHCTAGKLSSSLPFNCTKYLSIFWLYECKHTKSELKLSSRKKCTDRASTRRQLMEQRLQKNSQWYLYWQVWSSYVFPVIQLYHLLNFLHIHICVGVQMLQKCSSHL